VLTLISSALVSLLTVGAGLSTLLLLASEAAIVPAEGGCRVIPRGRSAARVAVPGAGAKAGPLCAECWHLVGGVLDTLQTCCVVGEVRQRSRAPAGVRPRRCGPRRPSRPRAGRGEWPARCGVAGRTDAVEEVVWGEAPKVCEKLGHLVVAHLESKELADSLLS
jgi:hypothetical protein